MKAAVYYETGKPEVFRYEDVPDPVCPADGVLVEVQAISIEGGDTLHRAGGDMVNRPHIVGYQCAGVIREVGAQVQDRRPGQWVVAVMMYGSHAELAAVPALTTWVLPEGLDVKHGACVPIPFGTADDCLFEFARLQKGETALIHAGAGGVGIAAIQLAKRAGATVLATASSDSKLERLKEFGLDHGINYRCDDFVTKVRDLTGGGANVIVDSVGGKTLAGSIEALAYRGRISYVGSAGRDAYQPNLDALRPGNKTITGIFLGAELMLSYPRVHPMIGRHLADLASGALRVPIDREYPLSDAAAAHAYVESRQAFGRVLLIP
ncbi:MAG TPA: zinc-binding alcohol dehydrogenase family protein [Candidatus Acidoferrales bacterium]|nr:zinc-binding alcohol dehydrogenase family protein [Candidatus Acidoferrales bacterium]